MAAEFVLALDQGTTSSRAIVFDRGGRVRGRAQREFRQIFPEPGWVEHDPEEIWASQLATAREAIAAAGISADRIAGIGITNQRESTVVWERATGQPIANAIVWQDRRTAPACRAVQAAGHEGRIREVTGLLPDPYFSASKVQWLLDRVPGARASAEAGDLCFGTIDSWLVWRLTRGAEHVTDVTNASRTLLFDLRRLEWDASMLALWGVPASVLPRVVPSSGIAGTCAPEHFGAEIPITGIAGDQHAALFGQACLRPGMAKNTYGTGCFLLMHTGSEPVASRSRLLTTIAWKVGDAAPEYALEGSVFTAGAVVQWFRDQLGMVETSGEIEELAREVDDNGGVFLVPAFTGLGAPHWDPEARGAIVGLTRGTGRAHLARAALESIAFQVRDVLVAMEADAGMRLSELRVDGGAAANRLLMQFQADVLGVPVLRAANLETTALGAAGLAGIGAGVWRSAEEVAGRWESDARFEPAMARAEVDRLLAGWGKAVAAARGWKPD